MVKNSPKLLGLIKWEHISELNNKLDNGEAPTQLVKWVNAKGYKISVPTLYEYVKLRKRAIIESIHIEKLISPIIRIPITADLAPDKNTVPPKEKIKNELDMLDRIIYKGYETLHQYNIHPKLILEAIALKNKITEGLHEHLTGYGIQALRKIEQGKYQILADIILKYLPQELHETVLTEMEQAEEEYYKGTDYYEEYLLSKEKTN